MKPSLRYNTGNSILPVLLLLTLAMTRVFAQAMPQDQFATITNIMSKGGLVFMGGWGRTNSYLDLEQQRQINALALDSAKDLAVCSTQGEESVGAGNMAANNLLYLAGEGLITDARIIPCLLTGIKARPYRNSVISNSSLKTLALMTRRMPGAYAWSSDFDNKADTRKRKEIVAWWEDWWERNRDKHPVYDPEVDSIIWSAFLSVQDAIEEKVKPAHPELSLFHAQKNIRRLRPAMPLTQIYEYQYEPDMHSIPILYGATNGAIHAVGFNDLPWLEVACRFEDPEFPNRYEELRTKDRKPPERLTSMLTSVYSNHIAGTAIYLEVRVASPNKDLVRDLQTALQGLELSP